MKKEYLIFDFDWTLVESMWDTVKIIKEFLSDIEWTDIELVDYIFKTTPWMALQKQIEIIYKNNNTINHKNITLEIYEKLLKYDADFFDWVIDIIKELSKEYKLFLTTWNSTKVAEKHLVKWWIKDCFELIYWSDNILKWKDHLEIFKDYSCDEYFYQKSYYIWDGNSDRLFANEAWIDFIHIWNEWIDKYEIKSVKDINNIINNAY